MGYGTEETGTAQYQGVGTTFFQVAGGKTYDLTDIKVECEGGDGYMNPYSEYIRELSPESAGNVARYTYVNDTLVGEICGEVIAERVGWYLWDDADYDWETAIYEGDLSKKIAPGTKMFNVAQAFLGQFGGGCNFKFISSGAVVCDTTEFETGTAQYFFFLNYTPVNVKLTEIEVECEGGDGYMNPYSEYIRQLSPESAGNVARYTYVNADLVNEICGEVIDDRVGWYLWDDADYDWETAISEGDLSKKVGGVSVPDVTLTPGFSFLGQFGGGCNFHFKMPYPIR